MNHSGKLEMYYNLLDHLGKRLGIFSNTMSLKIYIFPMKSGKAYRNFSKTLKRYVFKTIILEKRQNYLPAMDRTMFPPSP